MFLFISERDLNRIVDRRVRRALKLFPGDPGEFEEDLLRGLGPNYHIPHPPKFTPVVSLCESCRWRREGEVRNHTLPVVENLAAGVRILRDLIGTVRVAPPETDRISEALYVLDVMERLIGAPHTVVFNKTATPGPTAPGATDVVGGPGR